MMDLSKTHANLKGPDGIRKTGLWICLGLAFLSVCHMFSVKRSFSSTAEQQQQLEDHALQRHLLVVHTLMKKGEKIRNDSSDATATSMAHEYDLITAFQGGTTGPSLAANHSSNDDRNGGDGTRLRAMQTLWDSVPEPTNDTMFEYMTLASIVRPTEARSKEEVVMLSHGSTNKLLNMLTQVRWWGGPADVAVYLQSKEDLEKLDSFIVLNGDEMQSVTFHITIERSLLKYPHNRIQNLLLDRLQCDYFVALDCDFIPNPGAHKSILDLIQKDDRVKHHLHKRHMFVLPAFEMFSPPNISSPTEDMLPKTKAELTNLVQQKKMDQFHKKSAPQGHGTTNYKLWLGGDNQSDTFYATNYTGRGTYEPYVLGYRHGAPRYWVPFTGHGYNKVTYFSELYHAGFQFDLLRDLWVIHMNHKYASREQRKIDTERNRPHFREFKNHLKDWYNKK